MQNKIDWQKSRRTICKFPLKLNITKFNNSDLTFGDYIVRFEYKFLRNIFTEDQLDSAEQIKNLENYYQFSEEYIKICTGLLAFLNSNTRNFINNATEKFVEEEFPDKTIPEIKNIIQKTNIKNALSQSRSDVYKFNLKIYAFVYDNLIFSPKSDVKIDTFTSNKFFLHVHRLNKGKIHLHHSHVTGQIHGHAHDFCNTILIEKTRPEIPLIAHNLFGFDIFYFIKTYVATAWCSKKLNIGGSNLTHVNYGIIDNEIKLIDSIKYYQESLAALSATLTDEEKERVEKITRQFFNQHQHFSTIWVYIPFTIQQKILNIVSSGKGVIPYELIINMESLLLTPDNEFWFKTEFFSELKRQNVDEEAYLNSKFLFKNLKMKHLGYLNDLYNYKMLHCCVKY